MTSSAVWQQSHAKAQPWIDWTNLTPGVLAASPWLAPGGGSAVMRNAVACGAIAAGVALSTPNAGAEWTDVGLGMASSPAANPGC